MQHCVITGGADGIGRALTRRAAYLGMAVTIIDRDAERSTKLCRELHSEQHSPTFIYANLAQEASVNDAIQQLQELPPVDMLIHSAGISVVGRFAESRLALQQTVLDVNLRAAMLLTTGLLREDRLVQGGSLVFIASLSVFSSYPGAAVYAASKDGIASYARSLRIALSSRNINVLTVYPGPTRTAHARRYSPDNSREARRMPPEQLAGLILASVQRRERTLIPGAVNRISALLGRLAPRLSEYIMRKIILDKLPSGTSLTE